MCVTTEGGIIANSRDGKWGCGTATLSGQDPRNTDNCDYRGFSLKPPPLSAIWVVFLLFLGVFCDFFKSYGSNPKTIIMFFVVLWEVVPPLKAIFDIMTQNRENRKKQVQK